MLIDALTRALRESEALSAVYSKLDAGSDAALGIASSARAFAVAARFADTPQPMLVVVPGEDAASNFARSLASFKVPTIVEFREALPLTSVGKVEKKVLRA